MEYEQEIDNLRSQLNHVSSCNLQRSSFLSNLKVIQEEDEELIDMLRCPDAI